MTHEEIYNYVRVLCGSLLLVSCLSINSCEDNVTEEDTSPHMEMWVNGDPINPYEYYAQVNTYGEKVVGVPLQVTFLTLRSRNPWYH